MEYKKYYLGPAEWAPKGRLVAYEKYSQIIPTQKIETEVIELAALEACQKRLDEAVGLLKEVSESRIAECQTANDTRLKYKIDDFLKGLGEG